MQRYLRKSDAIKMPDNYFRFKEFTIKQDKCSMKVCTDACIFGSVLPVFSSNGREIKHVLDIGAGTGLLSLMYAQSNVNAEIDAVEIEKNAYEQAKENFSGSKWNAQLTIFHTDIKIFIPEKKYDLIISNPPFYENDLLSSEKNKNIAKHHLGLVLKDIIPIIKNYLAPSGCLAILLPYNRIKYFESLAQQNNLFLKEKVLIRQTAAHNFFRGILLFSNYKTDVKTNELTIKNNDGYTEEFSALLRPYYLKL